jgi:hypothetical protein
MTEYFKDGKPGRHKLVVVRENQGKFSRVLEPYTVLDFETIEENKQYEVVRTLVKQDPAGYPVFTHWVVERG